jgi:CheY-like chemotaxis protein
MPNKKILIVEDEIITAQALRISLKSMGYEVCSLASSGEKAIQITEDEKPDVILMDVNLRGELKGFETAKEIHARFGVSSIYLSGYPEEDIKKQAGMDETFRFIGKPFEKHEIKNEIESIIQNKKVS